MTQDHTMKTIQWAFLCKGDEGKWAVCIINDCTPFTVIMAWQYNVTIFRSQIWRKHTIKHLTTWWKQKSLFTQEVRLRHNLSYRETFNCAHITISSLQVSLHLHGRSKDLSVEACVAIMFSYYLNRILKKRCRSPFPLKFHYQTVAARPTICN